MKNTLIYLQLFICYVNGVDYVLKTYGELKGELCEYFAMKYFDEDIHVIADFQKLNNYNETSKVINITCLRPPSSR
jgi:hypothetical protein